MIAKKAKFFSVLLVIFLLLCPVLGAGCISLQKPLLQKSSSGLPPELDIVSEAWGILFQDYVEKGKLDAKKMSQGAIKGMLGAIGDPYNDYLDSENYQRVLKGLEGKFHGIGAEVAIKDGQITVVAPIADSPAEKAGIRSGDRILEISGEPTSGMNLMEAVSKIRGVPGTSVDLLVLHQGETKPVVIKIIRAEIKLRSVFGKTQDNIAYIRLTYFSGTTSAEFLSVLKDVTGASAKGIILDLRNNSGGLLQTVVDVASQFLAEGIVVNVVDNEGKRTALPVKPGGIATGLPLVVLVNGGSASGSEVLAGALQDYGRAKLVGSVTFGKGSVNSFRPLRDNSALYLTIGRWLTPLGKPIEGVGLTPDFKLELEGEQLVDWAVNYLKGQIRAEKISELEKTNVLAQWMNCPSSYSLATCSEVKFLPLVMFIQNLVDALLTFV